ncbi:nickel pincer cofactor biosynthesis protein LarB [Acetohalobium arabaticum]|uniref:1-(5-phosphoribosyl)-5-amino-4-imidazole-carboxylate (AIR) carboxylase n=1 Tax=Acetohalobium arabaticum (strain ATCC 49924 / DSM 5501 / Z-7288) TaxID=574087 RepID=D9QTQ1_ACEAZ|nr:nickel pincer cofactor biosynthesis protein LarB [Acetohalobium arabaticum]ADL11815.1 1-(5-phosphoribosyl)-5-amino-4-imidazole- carboxylate (AIR) carboxylase [Acetohalobium arabaticum DSM 5501]
MQPDRLKEILTKVEAGNLDVDTALEELKSPGYEDLGFAKVDQHRNLRRGFPEVVLCEGKTEEQIVKIMQKLAETEENALATRADEDIYQAVKEELPEIEYNEAAKTLVLQQTDLAEEGSILVISAGTSDIPVAEEAYETARIMGNSVERLYDVGVAGIHRLLENQKQLRQARVVIVAAGMEGALASVVGGLVDKPVIGVPTSVGYGASFEGVASLLGMLNSCSAGVGVVNIDNGFGAAYLASSINKME